MIRLAPLGLLALSLPSFAEGTDDVGWTQRLRPWTVIQIDILSPDESISWFAEMKSWDGTITPVDALDFRRNMRSGSAGARTTH